MAFKRNQFALRVTGFQVSPDEMDTYVTYQVANPTTDLLATKFVGTAAVGGTSSVQALVITNKLPDYPRNVEFNVNGTGAGMAGTLVLNGFDQFGSAITETITTGTASNGGTTAGTKVFGQFTSGTVSLGTAVGNGTSQVRFSTGTATLFGLPVKIQNVTEVVHYGMSAGTGAISVGGGTAIGTLINSGTGPNVGVHAFRPFATFGGTTFFNVWIKPNYNGENEGPMAAGTQPS